jgi:hypothetical protein
MCESLVKKIVPLLCLVLAVFVFSSCENVTDAEFYDRQFIPVGFWEDDYDSSYTITKDTIAYDSPAYGNPEDDDYYPATHYEGDIISALDFSSSSGAVIILITEGDSTLGILKDKYSCVYYKNYSSTHADLANPIDSSYAPILTNTLNEALDTFTEGNMGTHVSHWGSGYNK